MFKIKIDVRGWDSFTGELGTVSFTNGISDREVTEREAAFIGANIKITRMDTNEQAGLATSMVNLSSVSAEVKAPLQSPKKEEVETTANIKYTREALDELASTGGLKAIREVAAEFNVKGVQITKMIDEIMEAQNPTKKAEK